MAEPASGHYTVGGFSNRDIEPGFEARSVRYEERREPGYGRIVISEWYEFC